MWCVGHYLAQSTRSFRLCPRQYSPRELLDRRAIGLHSNRVSDGDSLCCRETGFPRRRKKPIRRPEPPISVSETTRSFKKPRRFGAFRTPAGNLLECGTAWWWMHSRSNRSPNSNSRNRQNSLLIFQSGSEFSGLQLNSLRRETGNFWRPNREFFGANREFNRRIREVADLEQRCSQRIALLLNHPRIIQGACT